MRPLTIMLVPAGVALAHVAAYGAVHPDASARDEALAGLAPPPSRTSPQSGSGWRPSWGSRFCWRDSSSGRPGSRGRWWETVARSPRQRAS